MEWLSRFTKKFNAETDVLQLNKYSLKSDIPLNRQRPLNCSFMKDLVPKFKIALFGYDFWSDQLKGGMINDLFTFDFDCEKTRVNFCDESISYFLLREFFHSNCDFVFLPVKLLGILFLIKHSNQSQSKLLLSEGFYC